MSSQCEITLPTYALGDSSDIPLEVLANLPGCEVDLLSRRAVERSQNLLRRREILESAQIVFGTNS